MNYRPVYLDASAILKLIRPEPETDALMAALVEWPDRVASDIARVEAHRAMWRESASPSVRRRGEAVLSGIVFVRVDESVIARASAFKDPALRSLDAMHLGTALSLGDDPEAFVTYDARLSRAARKQKLRVLHPGVTSLD